MGYSPNTKLGRRPTEGLGRDTIEARARSYAALKRVPFTLMRQRVLAVLAATNKPLSAYEIAKKLSDKRKVQAVQVYRALEFLQEADCIHRIASRSAFFACDHLHGESETAVFMVCQSCGVVQEAGSELVARGLLGAVRKAGFKPEHLMVEVEGECAKCAARHAN